MNDSKFVILIGSLGFVSTLIVLWKDYWNKSDVKKGFKGFKSQFYVLAVIGFGILSLTIWQSISANEKAEEDKRQAAARQMMKDAILQVKIKAGTDSGIQKIVNGFSSAFKQQDLKMDSVDYTLALIKDTINSFKGFSDTPHVRIIASGAVPDTADSNNIILDYGLYSYDAAATNFQLKLSIFTLYDGGSIVENVADVNLLEASYRRMADMGALFTTGIPNKPHSLLYFFRIRGTYTSISGRVRISIDNVYEYQPVMHDTYLMSPKQAALLLSRAKRP